MELSFFLVVNVAVARQQGLCVCTFWVFIQVLGHLCLFKSDITLAVFGRQATCWVHLASSLVFFALISYTMQEQEKENKGVKS